MTKGRILRVLIVEDDELDVELLVRELRRGGYDPEFERVDTPDAMDAALAAGRWDLVISDYSMPHFSGLAALEIAHRIEPDLPFIVVSGVIGEEAAVEAMRAGARDFMSKGKLSRLLPAIKREIAAAEERKIHQAVELARQQAEIRAGFADALEQSNRELEAAYRELQDTQTQLIQAAKMASLGALVAGIAHEINNPLAFVSSHLTTVKNGLDSVLQEVSPLLTATGTQTLTKVRQRLDSMRMGVDRVEDIVVKLRTFSRLDESEVKAVPIEDSIESVLTLLQHKLDDRVTIIRNYGEIKFITCYPGPLNQVIMNVVANAIDAIDGEGSITISTSSADGMFAISIRDSGQGIPAAIRDRVFEPFFTTKPVGAGTGLGLSISYGIMQKHKGALEIQSEEGLGTEVTIRIPQDRPNKPAHNAKS